MSELNIAYTTINEVSKLAKALVGLRDAALMTEKVGEFIAKLVDANRLILEAQAHHATLLQENDDLKKQIVKFEQWEDEKQRYQLIEPWHGTFVYALKDSHKGPDPAHWICEHCYQDRRKSLLQNAYKGTNRRIIFVTCSHCHLEHETHEYEQTTRTYV